MERQLYKSKQNRVIAGVCGGIAEYFSIDPTMVRIIWIAASLIFQIGFIAYIIAMIIMPSRKAVSSAESWDTDQQSRKNGEEDFNFNSEEWKQPPPKIDPERSRNIIGIVLIIIGALFLGKQLLNWFKPEYVLPLLFIGIGVLIIYRKGRGSV